MLSTNLFYMDIDDIHLYEIIGGTLYRVSNGGKAKSQGIELEAMYNINKTLALMQVLGL